MTHPAIRDLLEEAGRHPDFEGLVRLLRHATGARARLSGLTLTAKALYVTLLWKQLRRPLVVVTDGNQQAEALTQLVEEFFHLLVEDSGAGRPQLLPALDALPHQRMSPHAELTTRRAVALWRLAAGEASITVAPIAAALYRLEKPDFYRLLATEIQKGEEIPFDELVRHLEEMGYQRREPVEAPGEFSVRGGIVDVFSPEASHPVRIEFFGDEVESIRQFDVESQRSVLKADHCTLLPLREYPATPEMLAQLAEMAEQAGWEGVGRGGALFAGWELLVPLARRREHLLTELCGEGLLVWDEPEMIAAAAGRLKKRLEDTERALTGAARAAYASWEELRQRTGEASWVSLTSLQLEQVGAPAEGYQGHIRSQPSMAFQGNVTVAVGEAKGLVEAGNRVLFCAASLGEVERLADLLQEYGIPYRLGLAAEAGTEHLTARPQLDSAGVATFVTRANIRRGVVLPEARLTLFGVEDLFETSELTAPAATPRSQLAAFTLDLTDLKPGDFVVHTEHGIGRFLGIREIAHGEQKGDYMLLEYGGEAKLYVPLTRLDLVEKYRGAGERPPTLDRLGGATWARTKARAKAKMRDMAEELLKLYAERKMARGFAFSADSNWQREFEDAFEYVETKDQLSAIKDIKRDMEKPHPMDRLLCGDVGFGKTEVAMRAAFKALGDGKQVAVLAPTTVLAFQHWETFKRRFAPFPVRVEMLSRFRTRQEIQAVTADVKAGRVDILIGTHRILSKDVEFADLGLLIIDEEQRFGVRHKEQIKQLRKNVDVLSMSATPIPRTLHMSLLGIRDLSVIETPPRDRLAIHTVVARFDGEIIRAAIEQELSRGGQVYFIHNRIDSIFARAAMIQELVPGCRIAVGHGQMGEAALEKVLLGFMRHEFDVFVSTTIVENGLDIPLANTIIIDHAERYGLSELYQLRGRVGRSNRRAYAYLLVPPDTELSELARKRLAALKEFSDLGAGFRIAALDLELRGAGNLLGGEQSGHIEALGFDTYLRLLEQTISELKGEPAPLEIHSKLNLGLDLRIPASYISDEQQRLRAYKRIADLGTKEAAASLEEELADRYGKPPEQVRQLIRFAVLKAGAQQAGITAIERRQGYLNVQFHPESRVDPARLMDLVRRTAGAQFTPAGVLKMPWADGEGAERVLEGVEAVLEELAPREGA